MDKKKIRIVTIFREKISISFFAKFLFSKKIVQKQFFPLIIFKINFFGRVQNLKSVSLCLVVKSGD